MCTIVEMSENLDFGGPEAPPKYETLFAFESTLRVSWMFPEYTSQQFHIGLGGFTSLPPHF